MEFDIRRSITSTTTFFEENSYPTTPRLTTSLHLRTRADHGSDFRELVYIGHRMRQQTLMLTVSVRQSNTSSRRGMGKKNITSFSKYNPSNHYNRSYV